MNAKEEKRKQMEEVEEKKGQWKAKRLKTSYGEVDPYEILDVSCLIMCCLIVSDVMSFSPRKFSRNFTVAALRLEPVPSQG
jgi:hypothetical protein